MDRVTHLRPVMPGQQEPEPKLEEVKSELAKLGERSREIFRQIVESYLETGTPVGSRNLSRALSINLSPASVRNVMADLEALGLIFAPHTSAGRLPTELGLRFFVDALMQFGELTEAERLSIEAQVAAGRQRSVENVLTEAGDLLSGLSRSAAVVLATKNDVKVRHVEFVRLDPRKCLVVLVGDSGAVENRLIDLPEGVPADSLVEAANYLNAHLRGKTLAEARRDMERAREEARNQVAILTERVIEAGLASLGTKQDGSPQTLIVRGQANLLEDLSALEDLERVQLLLADLERKNDIVELLGLAESGEGVRIFIGSENKLFSLSGSSVVLAPYRDRDQSIVGVLGVIGPTRLNYARIVPMVDYTAKLVGRILGDG
ncbi:MAG: heat-inducible transcriptional repressor HrcA [Rhodobiaceae bacterium]|nr:heat-inducible transcriptional repressor HrcA [Rhodobiaceae bacterium]MCC0012618.1 heat-inducible transcriptional repressor HrcA [Rhodobiaceae bacterium]MCC0050759.1 heat-inducible transcriptional repressor HrcA [Rhodobiaceae bacterium]MCC0061825.1 heat-inducible transcriptional repressor HrcA [Rhodobiaceae bacterium]